MLNPRHLTSHAVTNETYSHYVNPQWVKLLNVLGMNKHYVGSSGVELYTEEGEVYLDFLSGYGVYNVGHHHPKINEALREELLSGRPTMLQSHVPDLAAELACTLCARAGGTLERAFFGSTGSEGVETALKFSRRFTGRDSIAYAAGGFHGLTCGALSLMSNPWWKAGFGSLLPHTQAVPFGDIEAARALLNTKRYAAFILEPVQAESGVIVPSADYLKAVQQLCRDTKTLFVIDEVQTGVYRCGPFLASHHLGIEPDMVILAKALSGGQVPVGAVLMRQDICDSVYSSIDRAFVHASTFSENALSMRAALSTLQTIEEEGIAENCVRQGERLRAGLQELQLRHPMIRSVRGVGLMNGIEFGPPPSAVARLVHAGISKIHPGLFGQVLVKAIYDRGKIITQMCGNNFNVVKVLPPLVVQDAQVDHFISTVDEVVSEMESGTTSFWSESMALAMRAFGEVGR